MTTTMLVVDETGAQKDALVKEIQQVMDGTQVKVMADTEQAICASEVHEKHVLLIVVRELQSDHMRLLQVLQQTRPCPVILFTENAAPEMLKQTIDLGVSVVIHGPLEAHRLPTLCAIANARYEVNQKLYGELADARNRLADRKLLDRAKGLLMAQKQLSEPEAYALLRKQAMDKGLRLGVVAQQVIELFDMLALNDSSARANRERKEHHNGRVKSA
ncbi:MAG: ANTAR domain-containing protein [Oleiphilaceae bacterium]|nr:ANTAR domain-containing protein [Oleiphilaceae bacterium]